MACLSEPAWPRRDCHSSRPSVSSFLSHDRLGSDFCCRARLLHGNVFLAARPPRISCWLSPRLSDFQASAGIGRCHSCSYRSAPGKSWLERLFQPSDNFVWESSITAWNRYSTGCTCCETCELVLPQLEPKPYQTHSLRTFWSMLVPWPRICRSALYVLSAAAVLVLTIACWKRRPTVPLSLRYSALLLATVLVAPHLTVYDLVILTPAFILLADWLIGQNATRSTLVVGNSSVSGRTCFHCWVPSLAGRMFSFRSLRWRRRCT